MKFLQVIESYNKTLNEQVPVDPNAPIDPAAQQQPPAEPAQPEPPAEEPAQPDVPASIVRLARLLKQALIMKINDDDSDFISNLPEINEKNANEIIQQMTPVMRKYATIEGTEVEGETGNV